MTTNHADLPAVSGYEIFPAEDARYDAPEDARADFMTKAVYLSRNGPLLIRYHGENCPGCVHFAPVLDKIMSEAAHANIKVPMLVVSLDRLQNLYPDRDMRRQFISSLKQNAFFPDLQIFDRGYNKGSLKISDIGVNMSAEEADKVLEEETREFIFTHLCGWKPSPPQPQPPQHG